MVYVESAARSRQIVSAARTVITRDGVAATTIRSVAKEAGIPLGTLQYVFPTKQQMMRAVIEDVIEEISATLRSSAPLDSGLEHALAEGVRRFWNNLVVGDVPLQLAQYELTTYALRSAGLEDMARRQYEGYTDAVAGWIDEAAERAGEEISIETRRLARLLIAGVDGLILQYVSDPDPDRGRADMETVVAMVIRHAGVRPAAGG
ncbi:MAG: TetR/AcrR family transcriptional regulator [Mycobacterium sp.]